ncbi:MAG: cysteine hydrolase [Holophaga sp.]|nr:cysteine hydrolase [Holophaga sp.]
MLPATTALLLIDCQMAWDDPYWGARNNPGAEGQIARLLAAFRQAGHPVIHVKHNAKDPHSPLHPAEPGNAFKPEAMPLSTEMVFEKSVHAAFIGTGLEAHLREQEIDRLVIAGFITNWCVSSTARMANNLGFKAVVVHDACATFAFEDPFGEMVPADTLHRVGLTELHGAFAMVLGTDDLLAMV